MSNKSLLQGDANNLKLLPKVNKNEIQIKRNIWLRGSGFIFVSIIEISRVIVKSLTSVRSTHVMIILMTGKVIHVISASYFHR